MKKVILDLSGNKVQLLEADAALSFRPFMEYLRKRIAKEKTVRKSYYQQALKEFENREGAEKDIPLENIHEYELLLEYMYACLSPVQDDQEFIAWGLCFPLQPINIYGTDSLYELLKDSLDDKEQILDDRSPEDINRERLRYVYAFILGKLYDFHIPLPKEKYHASLNHETGLLNYYHVLVNTDFIEVTVKGDLPKLDFREVHEHLGQGMGYEMLENILPLDIFQFRGISVLAVRDVTAQMAVENINKMRLNRVPGEEDKGYQVVMQSLKSLLQNNRIEFDFFPFVRVNDKPVYGYEKGGTGILFSVWGEKRLSPDAFQQLASSYIASPNSFFSPDITKEDLKQFAFLVSFIELGIRSLALIPLFYNQTLVGVLAVHTYDGEFFNESALARLEPAIPPIAQLLQVYINEFNLEIEDIIKEKFTSIQPSVQWKFNEVAWHYLHNKKKHLPERTESIYFNAVYPLYGAIDIRNSTIERNIASKADLEYHLNLLSETLQSLTLSHSSSLMEEMIFNCKKWQSALNDEHWNTTEENNLNNFLKTEMIDYLNHLAQQDPKTHKVVQHYLDRSVKTDGEVHKNRYALEVSMQMINNAVNNYFEAEKEKLQQSYPCYFEKFRTDGVEYDIYIGQSIAPKRAFNHFHLKNLRLWQLSSMAAVAKLTHSLLPGMPKKLQTTQLIFVHNQTIDISFRSDERKFDVEGAYNIRYQMIKKRIDKVLVSETGERLTQPDKLAIIYFSRKDVEDYLPFIQYLQETGVLHPELEELNLEDVQGLSGLKALRIGIVQE